MAKQELIIKTDYFDQSCVGKEVLRDIGKGRLQFIMARAWMLICLMLQPLILPKSDLPFGRSKFSWFVFVSPRSRGVVRKLFDSQIFSHGISTTSFQPRIIVISEMLIWLNKPIATPGPGTFKCSRSLIFSPIFIDFLDFKSYLL